MSYSFGMFFKQIEESDVLDFFSKANNIMIKESQKIIIKSKFYIPSLRSNKNGNEVDEYWLDTLFTLNFVYWKEFNLLGLSGYSYPEELESLFDCHIGFQNSCDQDYDYEYWSDKIMIFKEIKEKTINSSLKDIINYCKEYKSYSDEDEEDIKKNIEYHKKSVLYDKIYCKLALGSWLYGQDDDAFSRYSINPIDCMEKKYDIIFQLKDFKEKLKGSSENN